MPKETIYEDYLRSNDYILPMYQKVIDGFAAAGGEKEISLAILGVKKEYLFGALKLDMIFSDPRPISESVPFFLAPASAGGFEESTVSLHARQSTIGAAFTGPQFSGFQSGGHYTNLLWDVNQTFRVGFEIAYRDTAYVSPLLLDNQGVGFHTQLQWLF